MAGVNTVISSSFNDKGIKQAQGAFEGFGKKAGLAIAGVAASMAAIGAAKAFQGLVSFTKDSIRSATDLQESMNAVEVSFGSAAEGVLAIGENAAKSLGVSRTEFNEAAVRFSAFAERVVGEGGNVAGFIEDISQRATDFASVFNIDVAEALQVFQSGLAGEAEPLKRFGINLLQTEVAAYAVEEGISASASAMTEAEKVQARYGLLMEQTNKTAGDFANTSDSLANTQRTLEASMEDLRSEIGVALLPAMETFAGIAQDDLLPILQELGETAAPVLATVLEELAEIAKEQLLPGLEDFGKWLASPEGKDAVDGFTEALGNTAEAIGTITTAFQTLNNNPAFSEVLSRLEFFRDNFTAPGWIIKGVNAQAEVGRESREAAAAIEQLNSGLGTNKIAAFEALSAIARYNEELATTVNTGSLAGVLEASAGKGMGGGEVGFDAEEYLKNLGLGTSTGEAQRAAEKLARSRDQLLERVGNLSKDFARVTGISETPLGEFEQNVNKTFENVTGIIDKALADDVISSRVSGQLQKIAKSARITALGIAREREAIAQDYEKLLNKLDAARAVRESTRDQISALANLKELGTMTREVVNDLGEVEEETTFTVDNIVNNLEKLLTETMD